MEYGKFSVQSSDIDREMFFSSLLIDEIENENIDKVKWLLLQKNADPNLVLPKEGVSPMHVLAGFENECFSVEVLEIVLEERDGDPNIRSFDGLTPVHVAALWGRCMVLEILLKFGGDPYLLEYKSSLNAEDLALKEHQWKTHAILATFSVFHDKDENLNDCLHTSSLLSKSSIENVEWHNSCNMALDNNEVGTYKEYPLDCGDSIPKHIKSKDSVTWAEAECKEKAKNQIPATAKSISSYEESLHLYGNKPIDGENAMEHNQVRRKKKLSDQFAESLTKFKNFFGRSSFPKLSSDNSPKANSKRKGSKTSI